MEHPLPNGTIVRVTGQSSPVEVADYVYGHEAEPPGLKGFYYLNSPQGSNDVISDEDEILEVVATPEEARAKRVPTRAQIAKLFVRLCGQATDDLEIDGADFDPLGDPVLFGKNEYGQRFAVVIQMSDLIIADTDF